MNPIPVFESCIDNGRSFVDYPVACSCNLLDNIQNPFF